MSERPAVFLDRDGTIIEDRHYVNNPDDVHLIEGAGEAIRMLRKKGYLIFVVSNQSGLSRGLISDKQFEEVHQRVCNDLKIEACEIDQFCFCFHHPDDGCKCRKPCAGLIPRVWNQEKIAFEKSFTVGDSLCDIELADTLGAKGALVLTGKGLKTKEKLEKSCTSNYAGCYKNLLEFAKSLPSATEK